MPLTWEVFPAALSTAIQYASLNFPVDHSWTRYNGLQQLSYFTTVFIAAPVSIATGASKIPRGRGLPAYLEAKDQPQPLWSSDGEANSSRT